MELKNGYKVIYDEAANGEHTFYASKTGVFADAEELVKIAAGEYKLVYEKDGKLYGSTTGIPAGGDTHLSGFDKVLAADDGGVEAGNEPDATNEEPTADPAVEEPEVSGETPVEDEAPATGDDEWDA
jgi:hypothetical protein